MFTVANAAPDLFNLPPPTKVHWYMLHIADQIMRAIKEEPLNWDHAKELLTLTTRDAVTRHDANVSSEQVWGISGNFGELKAVKYGEAEDKALKVQSEALAQRIRCVQAGKKVCENECH